MLLHSRRLFGALFLSTGAALLVYILSGVSLLAAVTVVLALAAAVGSVLWHRSATTDRAYLGRALRIGLIAGLLATATYDLARLALVYLAGFTFWPFDIFTIFGQALFGAHSHGPLITIAGVGYHLTNGVSFAIAYTIVLGRRGVLTGILWAMVLELLMVSIYPGWLGLKALDEFIQVSMFGHVVYGSVLGFTTRYLLTGERNRYARAVDVAE